MPDEVKPKFSPLDWTGYGKLGLSSQDRRRPLNHLEARQRAQELWGDAGAVERREKEAEDHRFIVGTKGALPGAHVIGRGSTWEEAFEDARKKGAF